MRRYSSGYRADAGLDPDWAAASGAAGMRFDTALADCPAFRGDNELGISLTRQARRPNKDPTMEVLEVWVL